MFLSTFQDICLYHCRICRHFEFDRRFQCERHMLGQHSGNGCKCSLCKQVFNRPDNHKSKCPGATFSTVNRKTGKFTSADEQDFTLFEQNLSALLYRVPRPSWSPPRPSPRDPKKTNLKLILKEMLFLLHPSYQPITEPISPEPATKVCKVISPVLPPPTFTTTVVPKSHHRTSVPASFLSSSP